MTSSWVRQERSRRRDLRIIDDVSGAFSMWANCAPPYPILGE